MAIMAHLHNILEGGELGDFVHRLTVIEASFGSQLCFRLQAMKTLTLVDL
jgi:hypothetical protein